MKKEKFFSEELCQAVARKCGTNKVFTESVVKAYLNSVSDHIASGGEVRVPYIGTILMGESKMGNKKPVLVSSKQEQFFFRERAKKNNLLKSADLSG